MAEHRLDLERRQRLGLVEAVWGEHKSAEQIIPRAHADAAPPSLSALGVYEAARCQ